MNQLPPPHAVNRDEFSHTISVDTFMKTVRRLSEIFRSRLPQIPASRVKTSRIGKGFANSVFTMASPSKVQVYKLLSAPPNSRGTVRDMNPSFSPHFSTFSPRKMATFNIRSLFPALGRGVRSFATGGKATLPVSIRPSSTEIEAYKLNDRNLETAVRHLYQDGLVVVEDVVPHEHLDLLNEKMVQDARTLQSRGEDSPFNYNQGNLQQGAPPVAKYFLPSIFSSTLSHGRRAI